MSYNSICPKCGFNAYIGFTQVECSNSNCEFYKEIENSIGEESARIIDFIMNKFNFYGVNTHMIHQDTKWVLCDDMTGTRHCSVPTIQDLRERSRYMLSKALEQDISENSFEDFYYGLEVMNSKSLVCLRYKDRHANAIIEEVIYTK